ncbi:MAG: glycosyltransferase family 9 protein [Anaerolineae bacterium]
MKARLRTAVLRAVAWASKPWSRRVSSPPPFEAARILLIRPDHVGDLLFTTPAIRALRLSLPDAYIACMVGPWAAEIVQNSRHLDEVRTCPFPGFTREPKKHLLGPYIVLWRYSRILRAGSFDAAVIMRFDHWWGAMLACWAGIPRRVGYGLPAVAPFLTEALPYTADQHEVEQNVRLISAVTVGNGAEPGPLEFHPRSDDIRSAARLLASVGSNGGYLCLHPGAGAPVKLWRREAFAQVGDALAQEYGLRVVITGSAGERQLAESIAERMEFKPHVIAGQTGLGELAAIMANSRLVIGVDSGALHLAVTQGVPTIHLYGPVDHRTFGPWGDPRRHIALVSDMECVPCQRLDYGLDELDDHPCVRSIPVAQVLEAARYLLGSSSLAGGAMV